ncbi:hypothetical protein HPB48_003383 [Haemaphysalis longicornis]|uniref:Uncharacterized protein n=1 Tax=Haemaphysalis longicornis TaxID=44386 RepID=A0A9J6GC34_HAELO|nr:hypothetical protein HPB48_003383 [Haemaphysalis longicornis]
MNINLLVVYGSFLYRHLVHDQRASAYLPRVRGLGAHRIGPGLRGQGDKKKKEGLYTSRVTWSFYGVSGCNRTNQSQHRHRATRAPVIGPSGAFHWEHTNQSQRRLRISRPSVRVLWGLQKWAHVPVTAKDVERGADLDCQACQMGAFLFVVVQYSRCFLSVRPRVSRKDACSAPQELSNPVERVAGRFGGIPRAARNTFTKQHVRLRSFVVWSRSLQLPPPPGNST